jgi:hypothetical protein
MDVDGPIPHSVYYVDDDIGVASHLPWRPTNDGTPHYTTRPHPVDQTPVLCTFPLCSIHKDVTLVIYQAQQWYRGLGCSAPDKAQVYPHPHHLLEIG